MDTTYVTFKIPKQEKKSRVSRLCCLCCGLTCCCNDVAYGEDIPTEDASNKTNVSDRESLFKQDITIGHKSILRLNQSSITKSVRADDIVDYLIQDHSVSQEVEEYLQFTDEKNSSKMRFLLDYLRRSSEGSYYSFLAALRNSRHILFGQLITDTEDGEIVNRFWPFMVSATMTAHTTASVNGQRVRSDIEKDIEKDLLEAISRTLQKIGDEGGNPAVWNELYILGVNLTAIRLGSLVFTLMFHSAEEVDFFIHLCETGEFHDFLIRNFVTDKLKRKYNIDSLDFKFDTSELVKCKERLKDEEATSVVVSENSDNGSYEIIHPVWGHFEDK